MIKTSLFSVPLSLFCLALPASQALAQATPDSGPTGPQYGCATPLPKFTLAPGKTATDSQVATLCGCLWEQMNPADRQRAEAITGGTADEATMESFSSTFGNAFTACGGDQL